MNTKPPECWASDPQARGLRIEISPERTLLLPFDQFAFAELTRDGKEQQLRLVFASHEVTICGHSLRRIETAMQRLDLSHLAPLPTGYDTVIAEGQPVVRKIMVMEAKELPDQQGTSVE